MEATHRFPFFQSLIHFGETSTDPTHFQPPESQRCDDKTAPQEEKKGLPQGPNHYFECLSGLLKFNQKIGGKKKIQFAQLHFKQLQSSQPIKVNDGGHSIALLPRRKRVDDDAMQHQREHQLVTMGSVGRDKSCAPNGMDDCARPQNAAGVKKEEEGEGIRRS